MPAKEAPELLVALRASSFELPFRLGDGVIIFIFRVCHQSNRCLADPFPLVVGEFHRARPTIRRRLPHVLILLIGNHSSLCISLNQRLTTIPQRA
jgi:hypothetical protein